MRLRIDLTSPLPISGGGLAFSGNLHASKPHKVAVSSLTENVFYASVEVVGPDGRSESVDSRPSDALNVALATGAPTLVEARVFDACAHPDAPPPFPDRDAFGTGSVGAGELVAEAVAGWPRPTHQPPGGTNDQPSP